MISIMYHSFKEKQPFKPENLFGLFWFVAGTNQLDQILNLENVDELHNFNSLFQTSLNNDKFKCNI